MSAKSSALLRALRDFDASRDDANTSSSLASVRKVVVGLDFGTYGTGISYKTMKDDEVCYCDRWPGRAEPPYPKALTAMLYKGSQAIHWGWEAERTFRELTDSQKKRGGYHYVTQFKLGLDSSAKPKCQLPPGKTVIQVIADFLRLFTKHCLETVLPDVYGPLQLATGSVQWCLTVPAIWKDDQKDAMRQAAYLAGMIPERDSSLLRIILEPEAAALHAIDSKKTPMADLLNLQPGDTFMMLDAGGGTVDLTVHTVMRKGGQLVLEETVPGDGDFCGSTYVDREFEAWFRSKVGAYLYDVWKKENYGEYMLMFTKWEEEKRLFKVGPKPRKVPIIIPPKLLKVMDDSVVLQLEEDDGYDDRVFISQQQMKSFFEPHIRRIVELARGLACKCPGGSVDKILLAGGFCKSPYLAACLKERLGGVACPTHHICVPETPESIIMQGAALAYSGPAVFVSRRLRLTYGYNTTREAADSVPANKKEWDVEKNCYKETYFCPIASLGQSIKVDEEINKSCRAWAPSQNRFGISLYTVPNTTTRYLEDEPSAKHVASITVPVVPGGEDDVNVSFLFGQEEVKIRAQGGKATKEPITVQARYSQNSF